MSADSATLAAGSTWRASRNGHPYDPTTGARTGALDPNGEHPDIGFGGFTIPDLHRFASSYEGNIVAIHAPGDVERIKQIDEGATDFFARHTDGQYYRSDRFGTISWPLRDLKPDTSGVIATGEVGEGSGVGTSSSSSTSPPQQPSGTTEPGQASGFYRTQKGGRVDTTQRMRFEYGTSKWGTNGMRPGVTAEGEIDIPVGLTGSVTLNVSELTVGAGANSLRLTADGEEVINYGAADIGGGIASVALNIGKDAPKPRIYGKVTVAATVDRPCELLVQWGFPQQQ